jgi:hypothetical protein
MVCKSLSPHTSSRGRIARLYAKFTMYKLKGLLRCHTLLLISTTLKAAMNKGVMQLEVLSLIERRCSPDLGGKIIKGLGRVTRGGCVIGP